MASSCGEVTRWQPESGRADSMFPFVNPELGFCIQKKMIMGTILLICPRPVDGDHHWVFFSETCVWPQTLAQGQAPSKISPGSW